MDRPVALIAARLSDVAPDGAATRVSYGLLNLTHRESHEHPTAVEPGRRYRVRLQLNDVAQAFPAGHRIRLALSTAYWPTAWPAPEPVTLTLYAGASTLTLPVRPPDPADAALPPLPPVETPPPLPVTVYEPSRSERVVHHNVTTGEVTLDWTQDSGRHRYDDIDLTVHTLTADRFTIRPEDPAVRVRRDRLDGPARPRELARGDADPDTAHGHPGHLRARRDPRGVRGRHAGPRAALGAVDPARSGLMDGRPRRPGRGSRRPAGAPGPCEPRAPAL